MKTGPKVRSIEERFWKKILFCVGEKECWMWVAGKSGTGYGTFYAARGKCKNAHRLSYELLVGKVSKRKQIDHLCRNRACVNPNHMEIVTQAENIKRGNGGSFWRAKTHCPHGHPYDDKNTIHTNQGTRRCAICRKKRR